jgi:hypothetical protein
MGDVDIQTALDWRGRSVLDRDGESIGTLKEIYLDEADRPHWGSVHTGLLGLRQTLVPLDRAQAREGTLQLPFDRQHVQAAPNLDPDVQLTADEEQQLYEHYGQTESVPDEARAPGAVAAADAKTEAADAKTEAVASRDTSEADDDAMTRSEEEVRITKRRRERGRARLKKYVVTDNVEKKVPVQREEVRVEYEPPARESDGDE